MQPRQISLHFDRIYLLKGAIPHDRSFEAMLHNGQLLNATLGGLQSGDTLFFPNKTYHLIGNRIFIEDVIKTY
jgi:hypothetical protein